MSAAEKQKLYRQRRDADPVRRAEYLEKRRQGYVNDILTKKRKNVGELSEREKRAQRKAWRVNQARRRQQMRAVQTVLTDIIGAVPPTQEDQSEPQTLQYRPEVIESHHCGQWCIVKYDEQPYPGIILMVEEQNVKIKCMHRSSKYDLNKFYWPSPIEDVNWYGEDQVMCLMPEPVAVNKRYIQLDDKIWAYLKEELGL